MNGTDLWTLAVIVGLALVTVLTRSFFFISNKSWQLPHWAQRGLQYAPIAALSAVVVPEIITVQGTLISTWQDARLFAAAMGAGVYFWRRDVLLTNYRPGVPEALGIDYESARKIKPDIIYCTATGFGTISLETTIVSPSITASAQWNCLSSPAIAKPWKNYLKRTS